MERVLDIVVLGRAARNTAAIKNRQPIGCMYVQGEALPAGYVSIIAEELNVKEVKFVADASSFISYRAKPQLKTLGPRYGKLLPKINSYLAGAGVGDAVVRRAQRGRRVRVLSSTARRYRWNGRRASLSPCRRKASSP
jgi:isoleucyl-tRNA synthetase